MYYHASPVKGLTLLEPRISNHGIPLVYFSLKRENALVYLSNAVEKYCRETGFSYDGVWTKWAAYGFDPDGRQRIEEYYPDALEKTYRGVSGYIYSAEKIESCGFNTGIIDSAASGMPVPVSGVEFVRDAYEEILKAEKSGAVTVLRYAGRSEKMKDWIDRTVRREYAEADGHPEYRHFLLGNFPDILR